MDQVWGDYCLVRTPTSVMRWATFESRSRERRTGKATVTSSWIEQDSAVAERRSGRRERGGAHRRVSSTCDSLCVLEVPSLAHLIPPSMKILKLRRTENGGTGEDLHSVSHPRITAPLPAHDDLDRCHQPRDSLSHHLSSQSAHHKSTPSLQQPARLHQSRDMASFQNHK